MSSCQVCTEKYNKNTRNKVICPYGDCCYEACKTCVRTYILNTITDPHCMNCRKALNQKFLVENLNRSFFEGEYKKHRKQLLLDSELSRMADSMAAAQRQKLIDIETVKIAEQQKICMELRKQLKTESLKLRELSVTIIRIRNGNGNINNVESSERKKFIMPCPNENCHGYLSSQYKCDLCTMFTCPDCFELIGYNKTDLHTCNEDCVKSAEMIKKDTKACPNCGVRIHKIAGCNQMWCVECKTAFNYDTGLIAKGPIHNPHFYQWQATQNNGITPRNPGDVACGGLIQLMQLRNIRILITTACPKDFKELIAKLDNLHRAVSHITYYDIPHIRTNVRNLEDNEQLRIKYILNKKTKSELSTDILRNDNSRRKLADILHIYELLSVVGIETFANIIANKDISDTSRIIASTRDLKKLCSYDDNLTKSIEIIRNFIDNYDKLRIYCNNTLAELSVTYNMAVMQIDELFVISNRKKKFTSSMLSNKKDMNGAGCSTDPL